MLTIRWFPDFGVSQTRKPASLSPFKLYQAMCHTCKSEPQVLRSRLQGLKFSERRWRRLNVFWSDAALLVKNEPKIRGQHCCLHFHGLSCPSGPYTLKIDAVISFETLDNPPTTDAVSYTRGLESSCYGARNVLRRREEETGGWRKSDSIMRRWIITTLQQTLLRP